jgi:hypothetical protein
MHKAIFFNSHDIIACFFCTFKYEEDCQGDFFIWLFTQWSSFPMVPASIYCSASGVHAEGMRRDAKKPFHCLLKWE